MKEKRLYGCPVISDESSSGGEIHVQSSIKCIACDKQKRCVNENPDKYCLLAVEGPSNG